RGLDELRAFAQQLVTPFGERRMDRARQREHFAALLACEPCCDERTRRNRRFDHKNATRKPADDAIAAREVLRKRRRARRELGNDETAHGEVVREIPIRSRIDAIGTGSGDGDAASLAVERAAMRGRVDAEREPAYD